MKTIIAVIILSFCFTGYISAQDLKVISATEQVTAVRIGGKAPRIGTYPRPYRNIYYTITIGYKNLKGFILDSLYLDNLTTGLTVNGNIRVDSLNHTLTISVSPSHSTNGIPPVSGCETETRTIGPNFVVYEYMGKKYILPIKEIVMLKSCTSHSRYIPC